MTIIHHFYAMITMRIVFTRRPSMEQGHSYSSCPSNVPTINFWLELIEQQWLLNGSYEIFVDWTLNAIINGIMNSRDGRSPKATVIRPLFELDCGTSNVINDIKTDERGRFYGGTKCVESCDTNSAASGAFYGYESGKCLRTFFENVFISNWLTWVRWSRKFYYVDSCTYDIKEFDYDARTGDICMWFQLIKIRF